MESNRWLKAYDGELDMDFPTSLKTNSNTMKTNAKTTKKKKKKPTKNRVAGPNTNANQTNATKTITENDDATSATEPHTTKTNTNKNNVTLTLLPVEILRHIFEPLWDNDREAFTNLCCTSKILRLNSEYLFFRTVILSDKNKGTRQVTESMLGKLLSDDECNLWTCIRHIKVGPVADANWFYTTIYPALFQVLGRVKYLQSLTWRTSLSTTPAHSQTGHSDVLAALEVSQPHAKLNLLCSDRDRDGELMPLDEAVLTSPQLHTLDITVCLFQKRKEPPHSELQFLKTCLVRGGSVKVLRFDFGDGIGPRRRNMTGAPMNFQWEDTDHFPALEELSFPISPRATTPSNKWAYNLRRDNLLMWAQVMDWKRLRRLDFHSNGPSLFFEIFTDHVPNLKYLRWGTSTEPNVSGYRGSPTCASAFMASVTALDEVVFKACEFNEFVWAILEILNAQGPNLKSLTLDCQAREGEGFTIAQYWDLLERAPKLEYLKISSCGAFLKGVWEGKDSGLSPADKWNTAKRNKWALKPFGKSNWNDAHFIWVPGQRQPGTAPGQGVTPGYPPIPAPRRNYPSAVSEESPYLDYFG